MRLFAASFIGFKQSMGTPVVTSLTTPKGFEPAFTWPTCHELTPRWDYFRKPDFAVRYAAQLDRYGVARIHQALRDIRDHGEDDRLVLICHERDWLACHRHQFAVWWGLRTGEEILELGSGGEPIEPEDKHAPEVSDEDA